MNFAKSPSVSQGYSQIQTQSAFAQANIALKEAVFVDLSIRNDWDSRLPSPHSYLYPSAGISAIVSDLVDLPSALSFLKLNLNYAIDQMVDEDDQSEILDYFKNCETSSLQLAQEELGDLDLDWEQLKIMRIKFLNKYGM